MTEDFARKMLPHIRQGTADYVCLNPFYNWGRLTADRRIEPFLYRSLVEKVALRTGRPMRRIRALICFRNPFQSPAASVVVRYTDETSHRVPLFWGPVWFSTSSDWLICRAACEVLAEMEAEYKREHRQKSPARKNQRKSERAA
jgi:hypothetical protein